MLFNRNPIGTAQERESSASVTVTYQSKSACPHCGTFSSKRIHRNWLERIRTYFTDEVPFFCGICHEKYFASFLEFTFDHASTATEGLMGLHKALGPIRSLPIRQAERPARNASSKGTGRPVHAHSLSQSSRSQ